MRKLTADQKITYSVATAIMAASVLLIFIPEAYIAWVGALTFAASCAIAYLFIKKRSIHSYNKRQVLLIVSVIAALYLTLYYLSGIKYGFVLSSDGAISINSIFTNIIPATAIIVSSELLRSALSAENKKVTTAISYVIGVASAVVAAGGITSLRSSFLFTDFMASTLFPALSANLLFTYLSKRYGTLPNIAYRLILTLYVFFIPVISDVPRIIPAFVLLILPILTQLFIDMLFEKKRRRAKRRESKWRFLFPSVSGALMICLILLITCQFRFGILVIATESMSGEIEKGDAVVFESYENCGEIKENDVIVFEENNRRVVHRVVQINTVNGQRQYITKGDANDGVDWGYRTDASIVGVVRFKVMFVGYPSIWLQELFTEQRGGG